MRTIEEIKDLVAQERGYENWGKLYFLAKHHELIPAIDTAMQNYAHEAITADRESLRQGLANTCGDLGQITGRALDRHPYPEL